MPDSFSQLTEAKPSGATAVFDKLIESLKASKDYHRLFDATLMRKKQQLGLPLLRPTSLDDVPTEKRTEFEKTYVEAAREVGQLFLDAGQIANAWLYFRTIREPEPVAKALAAMPSRREPGDETEELIQVALFEGANLRGANLERVQISGNGDVVMDLHGARPVEALGSMGGVLDLAGRRQALWPCGSG